MILGRATLRRLCRARALLGDEPQRRRSIDEVARAVAISPFHFIRQFEAAFGLTPHQFRTQQRLERAKHLLAAGHASVTDVCFEVGFASLGSFSDLFRRRIGVAPSVYQRRWRPFVQVPGLVPAALTPGCLTLMGTLPADAFRSFREAPPQARP